jgi:hypothetical protein
MALENLMIWVFQTWIWTKWLSSVTVHGLDARNQELVFEGFRLGGLRPHNISIEFGDTIE